MLGARILRRLSEEEEEHHEEEGETDYGIGLIVFSVSLGIFIRSFLTRYTSLLPYTVQLLIFGIIVGLIFDGSSKNWGVFGETLDRWEALEPDVLLFTLLPILIFESAFSTDVHILARELPQIMALAGPGVLIGSILSAVIAKYVFPYGWGWNICLMFGAILSATDPVAVVAILKELGVSPRLGTLIEGESLLNDGTAIVVFEVFFESAIAGVKPTTEFVIEEGFRLSLGGVAVGAVVGILGAFLVGFIINDKLSEISFTVVVCYGAWCFAESTGIKVSGVLAVVLCGLCMSYYGKSRISATSHEALESFWEMLGYISNTIIFFVSGFIMAVAAFTSSNDNIKGQEWGYLIMLYVLLHVVRILVIVAVSPILRQQGNYKLSISNCIVLSYAGLRGAVGLILALIVAETPEISIDTRERILFYASGVAALTLLINGTTASWLLHYLKLDRSTKGEQSIFEQALFVIEEKIETHIHELKGDKNFGDVEWSTVWRYIPLLHSKQYWHRIRKGHIRLGDDEMLYMVSRLLLSAEQNGVDNMPLPSASVKSTVAGAGGDGAAIDRPSLLGRLGSMKSLKQLDENTGMVTRSTFPTRVGRWLYVNIVFRLRVALLGHHYREVPKRMGWPWRLHHHEFCHEMHVRHIRHTRVNKFAQSMNEGDGFMDKDEDSTVSGDIEGNAGSDDSEGGGTTDTGLSETGLEDLGDLLSTACDKSLHEVLQTPLTRHEVLALVNELFDEHKNVVAANAQQFLMHAGNKEAGHSVMAKSTADNLCEEVDQRTARELKSKAAKASGSYSYTSGSEVEFSLPKELHVSVDKQVEFADEVRVVSQAGTGEAKTGGYGGSGSESRLSSDGEGESDDAFPGGALSGFAFLPSESGGAHDEFTSDEIRLLLNDGRYRLVAATKANLTSFFHSGWLSSSGLRVLTEMCKDQLDNPDDELAIWEHVGNQFKLSDFLGVIAKSLEKIPIIGDRMGGHIAFRQVEFMLELAINFSTALADVDILEFLPEESPITAPLLAEKVKEYNGATACIVELCTAYPDIASAIRTRMVSRFLLAKYGEMALELLEHGHISGNDYSILEKAANKNLTFLTYHPRYESRKSTLAVLRDISFLRFVDFDRELASKKRWNKNLRTGATPLLEDPRLYKEDFHTADVVLIRAGNKTIEPNVVSGNRRGFFYIVSGAVAMEITKPNPAASQVQAEAGNSGRGRARARRQSVFVPVEKKVEQHTVRHILHSGMMFGYDEAVLDRSHKATYETASFVHLLYFDVEEIADLSTSHPEVLRGLYWTLAWHMLPRFEPFARVEGKDLHRVMRHLEYTTVEGSHGDVDSSANNNNTSGKLDKSTTSQLRPSNSRRLSNTPNKGSRRSSIATGWLTNVALLSSEHASLHSPTPDHLKMYDVSEPIELSSENMLLVLKGVFIGAYGTLQGGPSDSVLRAYFANWKREETHIAPMEIDVDPADEAPNSTDQLPCRAIKADYGPFLLKVENQSVRMSSVSSVQLYLEAGSIAFVIHPVVSTTHAGDPADELRVDHHHGDKANAQKQHLSRLLAPTPDRSLHGTNPLHRAFTAGAANNEVWSKAMKKIVAKTAQKSDGTTGNANSVKAGRAALERMGSSKESIDEIPAFHAGRQATVQTGTPDVGKAERRRLTQQAEEKVLATSKPLAGAGSGDDGFSKGRQKTDDNIRRRHSLGDEPTARPGIARQGSMSFDVVRKGRKVELVPR